jgi:hypothetical protein
MKELEGPVAIRKSQGDKICDGRSGVNMNTMVKGEIGRFTHPHCIVRKYYWRCSEIF